MDLTSAASVANTINDQLMADQEDQSSILPDATPNLDMWNLDSIHAGGLGADVSTAWFMPFNLDPPHLSPDDPFASSALFGNFDFGGQDLMNVPLDANIGDGAGQQ
jgi:hypothetical protein